MSCRPVGRGCNGFHWSCGIALARKIKPYEECRKVGIGSRSDDSPGFERGVGEDWRFDRRGFLVKRFEKTRPQAPAPIGWLRCTDTALEVAG